MSTVTPQQAKTAIESMGVVAECLLATLDDSRPRRGEEMRAAKAGLSPRSPQNPSPA